MNTVSGTNDTAAAPMPRRWLPLVGGVLMNMAIGTFYAVSVFLRPLEGEFGWTRAQTSWITTLAIVTFVSSYSLGGVIYDRKGPRIVAISGGLLFSLGYFLASQIHSILALCLTLGVCAGIGNGFCYVVPTSVASKWFPDKRGLAIGLMVGSFGAGSGFFGPLASLLIERVGWRATFQIHGLLFLVMTLTAALLLRNPPEDFLPPKSAAAAAAGSRPDIPTSQMIRMPTFRLLWVAYWLGTTAGVMVISQLVPFAYSAGHSAAVAAFAITVGAFGNSSGRIFSGWLSDRVGRINTIRAVLVVSAAAMPMLYALRENTLLFYVFLCVVYYCYGTQLSVYASTCADFYGTRYIGLNYGLLLAAFGVAGVLGPYIGGRVYVTTGEYKWAFLIAALLELIALAALSRIKGAGRELPPV